MHCQATEMAVKTVIRVKRRSEDDPVEAFVLSFKRRRTDDQLEDEEKAVLKFAGTVEHKDDLKNAAHLLKTKEQLTQNYKSHASDLSRRLREDHKSRSTENRFRVLSLNRSVDVSAELEDKEGGVTPLTILDVDSQDVMETQPNDSSSKYVYDLYSSYWSAEDDLNDYYMDNLLSVQPLYTEMEYRSSEDVDEVDPYEEDSNEENNWRNDYPDSDNSGSDCIGLCHPIEKMRLGDEVELSSDSADEKYMAMSGMTQGRSYDAYKKQVMRELNSESDDDDNDYYNAEGDNDDCET